METKPLILKYKWLVTGVHVKVTCYAGYDPGSLAKCGDLMFRREEWEQLMQDSPASYRRIYEKVAS